MTAKQLKERYKSVNSYLKVKLGGTCLSEEYTTSISHVTRNISVYIFKNPEMSNQNIAQQIVTDLQKVDTLIKAGGQIDDDMLATFGWMLFTADQYIAMKYFAYELKRCSGVHSPAYSRWNISMSHEERNAFKALVNDPTIRT